MFYYIIIQHAPLQNVDLSIIPSKAPLDSTSWLLLYQGEQFKHANQNFPILNYDISPDSLTW